MRRYHVYGLDVTSNVEMPGFPETRHARVDSDVAVVWPDVPGSYPGLEDHEAVYSSHYHPAEGGSKPFWLFRLESSYIIRWEDLCDFEVPVDGSKIVCHPWPGVDWGVVNPFIQGRILPLALNFRGAVTLHGAAVAVDGGVAALLGTSGTGKSTLSARFHSLGRTLVADDLVAVWQDESEPMVEWGPRHVRLDEASMDFVTASLGAEALAEPDYDKTRLTLRTTEASLPEKLPLRTIYLLQRVPENEIAATEIRPLKPLEVLPSIMQSISNRTILDKDRMGEQFALITKMLNKVPVKHLRYPSNMERLTEVCEAVNADR